METNIATQNRFYRRGLVLGLTLAEIAILVIFSLLLVLGALLSSKDKEIEQLTSKAKEVSFNEKDIAAQVRGLATAAGITDNEFDNLFVHLTLKIQEAKAYPERIASLKERSDQLNEVEDIIRQYNGPAGHQQSQERTKWLSSQLSIAKTVQEVVAGDSNPIENSREKQKRVEEGLQAFKEKSKQLDELEALIRKNPGGRQGPQKKPEDQSLAEVMRETMRTTAELDEKNANLRGQLRHLQRISLGKGTEHPPCWAASTGSPEYIFDITLTDAGIIVADNALPNRVSAQQKLPLQQMVFYEEISSEDFLRISKPLYEWSEKESCRFFVRVYDQTGPHEKSIYKVRLRTVESHFYKWEVRSGQ